MALTPPLGWSSWNCWGLLIDEGLVRETAASMVDNDLINYGWSYVNIDDGWQGLRGGKHNAIQPNPEKFTDMKKLADELHSEGMRLGIYSAPWVGTYAGFIGSYPTIRKGGMNGQSGILCHRFRRHGPHAITTGVTVSTHLWRTM